jgi:hypothetical protein
LNPSRVWTLDLTSSHADVEMRKKVVSGFSVITPECQRTSGCLCPATTRLAAAVHCNVLRCNIVIQPHLHLIQFNQLSALPYQDLPFRVSVSSMLSYLQLGECLFSIMSHQEQNIMPRPSESIFGLVNYHDMMPMTPRQNYPRLKMFCIFTSTDQNRSQASGSNQHVMWLFPGAFGAGLP